MPRLALLVVTWLALLASATLAQVVRIEAESGQRFGTQIATSVAGYSGTGYVTGFDAANGSDAVQVSATVPDGLYELWIGYRSTFGEKGYGYAVDGTAGEGMFNQSNTFTADRAGVFSLTGATNTLRVNQSWGYYDVDYFELRPFSPPALLPVAPVLTNPSATHATQTLMNYLVSQYGQQTLSGQQHQSSQNLSFPVASYLSKSGGVVPAVRGSDLIEYSPTRLQYGANPRSETEQTIAWAQSTGGIPTVMWHWNAPGNLVNSGDYLWWRGFYTQGTTFNLPAALANPQGSDYGLLLRDIDAIAVQLQKYEDAGVPVLWRPLHEAQGGWFWWGAHGPETFKELWQLMHDRLTEHHGLDNLIWEFTSSAATGNHLDWYPGDDVVDMVGLDIYTDASSNMSGEWYDVLEHYNGRKLIALSETGTLPNADTMDQWGIEWSYFSPWSGSFVDAMSATALQTLLGHDHVVTLTELPQFPWNAAAARPGDYNRDGVVDAADFTLARDGQGTPVPHLTLADGDGDGRITLADLAVWARYFQTSGAVQSAAVPEPPSIAYWVVIAGLAAGVHRHFLA